MELVRLQQTTGTIFEEAMQLYAQSFPLHEQRLIADQIAVLGHTEYHFGLLYEQDKFIGLLLYWETERFIYVEHFCTIPAVRGSGYGLKALQMLGKNGKPVILEIDPPIDPISIRRQGFYQRAGYQANSFAHVHPPYRATNSGHELVVMSHPIELSAELYHEFFAHLCSTVMFYSEKNKTN